MTDENVAGTDGATPSQDEKINANVLRPIDELIKTMQMHDQTVRDVLVAFKRLFKQSKGQGTPSLAEQIQLAAALYGLVGLNQTQNVIVGQQLSTDTERAKWHTHALQEFLFEQLLGVISSEDREKTKVTWRARIDELFRAEKQKAVEARAALFQKHKEDILADAVGSLNKPALQKQETPEAPKSAGKIITLPRG